jgi:hypothetical protein
MDQPRTFQITGVDRSTERDVQFAIEALTEANARVKAELRNVIVTSATADLLTVEGLPAAQNEVALPTTATRVDSLLRERDPMDSPEQNQPLNDPSGLGGSLWSFLAVTLGWIVCVLGLLGLAGQLAREVSSTTSVRAMLFSGDDHRVAFGIGQLIGSSLFGAFALVIGLFVFLRSGRRSGKVLVIVAASVLFLNICAQLR